jgi:hypothetical protein
VLEGPCLLSQRAKAASVSKEKNKRVKMAKRRWEKKRPQKGQAASWKQTVPAFFGAVGAAHQKAEKLRKNAAIKKVSDRAIFDRPVAVPRGKQ